MANKEFFRVIESGVMLFVRVTPNANTDCIDGAEIRDDGSCVLKLRVRAVPDKGQANKAVIALLAKSIGVTKSAITLQSGGTARQKTFAIEGNAERLAAHLSTL